MSAVAANIWITRSTALGISWRQGSVENSYRMVREDEPDIVTSSVRDLPDALGPDRSVDGSQTLKSTQDTPTINFV